MTAPTTPLTDNELCAWLDANSSGVYRPAAEAASRIRELSADVASLKDHIHTCNGQVVSQLSADNAALRAEVERLREAVNGLLEVAEKVVDAGTYRFGILRAMNTARAALEGKP